MGIVISDEDVEFLVKKYDPNGKGGIEYNEFIEIFEKDL